MFEGLSMLEIAASSFLYKLHRDLKCNNFFVLKILQRNKKVNRIRLMFLYLPMPRWLRVSSFGSKPGKSA